MYLGRGDHGKDGEGGVGVETKNWWLMIHPSETVGVPGSGDFMTNSGKYRRTDLQQLLESAQHTLAFSLPQVIWSYTPREFNKCADYLAGIARDYARDVKLSAGAASSRRRDGYARSPE